MRRNSDRNAHQKLSKLVYPKSGFGPSSRQTKPFSQCLNEKLSINKSISTKFENLIADQQSINLCYSHERLGSPQINPYYTHILSNALCAWKTKHFATITTVYSAPSGWCDQSWPLRMHSKVSTNKITFLTKENLRAVKSLPWWKKPLYRSMISFC